jgi:signal transduction histidine kinase
MKPDTLAFRLVAGAALWCALALSAGGWLLSSLFRQSTEQSFDGRLATYLESLIATAQISEDGKLSITRPLEETRFLQPFSGWYWQIDGNGAARLRSRSLWDQALIPAPGAPEGGTIAFAELVGPEGQTLRVVSRTISLPGASGDLVFRIAGDLAAAEEDIRRFNAFLSWSLASLALGLLTAMVIQVHFGLRPLRRLQRALADIRLGRTNRLEGRYPGEIEPLVKEMNALVEHNARVVERARTHVGNLAHALKTPLSVLANEASGVDHALADTVRRQTERMRRQVDHYLARARTAATAGVIGARTPVAAVIADLARTLRQIHRERAVAIDVDCPPDAVFRGDRHDLEEVVGNLLDNGCKWARSLVRVQVSLVDGRIRLRVDDDGPGLTADQIERVAGRGTRLDEQVPGSGLGLSIVRDIVALYGGATKLDPSPLGGLAVSLELPAGEGDPSPASPSRPPADERQMNKPFSNRSAEPC